MKTNNLEGRSKQVFINLHTPQDINHRDYKKMVDYCIEEIKKYNNQMEK